MPLIFSHAKKVWVYIGELRHAMIVMDEAIDPQTAYSLVLRLKTSVRQPSVNFFHFLTAARGSCATSDPQNMVYALVDDSLGMALCQFQSYLEE